MISWILIRLIYSRIYKDTPPPIWNILVYVLYLVYEVLILILSILNSSENKKLKNSSS